MSVSEKADTIPTKAHPAAHLCIVTASNDFSGLMGIVRPTVRVFPFFIKLQGYRNRDNDPHFRKGKVRMYYTQSQILWDALEAVSQGGSEPLQSGV